MQVEIIQIGQSLVRFYIERRRYTVVQALLELRPDLIESERLKNIFPVPNLSMKISDFLEKYEARQVAFKGSWATEWVYKLHGIGCELKNIQTGELFDWDMSDPEIFGKVEFEDHLYWRTLYSNSDKIVVDYLKWIKDGHHFTQLWETLERNKIVLGLNQYEWILTHSV